MLFQFLVGDPSLKGSCLPHSRKATDRTGSFVPGCTFQSTQTANPFVFLLSIGYGLMYSVLPSEDNAVFVKVRNICK